MSLVKDRRDAAAKASLSGTTTPVKQKEKAKRAAGHTVAASKEVNAEQAKQAKAKQKERDARVAKWMGLGKGDRVEAPDGRTGVVSYRHTHHDDKDNPIGMIGVLIDKPKGGVVQLGGRTVKCVSFPAADLKRIS